MNPNKRRNKINENHAWLLPLPLFFFSIYKRKPQPARPKASWVDLQSKKDQEVRGNRPALRFPIKDPSYTFNLENDTREHTSLPVDPIKGTGRSVDKCRRRLLGEGDLDLDTGLELDRSLWAKPERSGTWSAFGTRLGRAGV